MPESIPDREEYSDGLIKAVREGKNIFISGNMSEQEHKAYVQRLTDNRPEVVAELNNLIAKLSDLINAYDKIFVLGGISAICIHKVQVDDNEDGQSEILLEYCQSIALASPNINKGKRPDTAALEDIYERLDEIKNYYSAFYATEHLEKKMSKIEYDMRFAMRSEFLHIRGDGYLKHLEELFYEMFTPHDTFFQNKFGFKSTDIVRTFRQLESSFTLRVASPDRKPHPFLEHRILQWKMQTMGNGDYPTDFIRKNPGVAVVNGGLMIYPLTWIQYHEELFRIRHFNETQKKVVDALAMTFGENTAFTSFNKYEILNPSDIYSKPIIKGENNSYYLFAFNLGARNYFNIAQKLIKSKDPAYYNQFFLGNKHASTRDNYIEKKVLLLFKKMLPNVTFYPNVKYTFKNDTLQIPCAKAADGKYELDIIGVSDKATYIIEVKAGLVSEDSKRGAPKSMKTDFSKIIGNAVCQSYRAYRYIKENSSPIFSHGKKDTVLPKNRENVLRISVSFSYLGAVISSLIKLKEFGAIDDATEFAWTINIFDLMPFAEIIASEDEFIDYLSKRIPMYQDKRLERVDEMDMLGLYYDNDLKIDPAFDNSDWVQLNGYKDDIDEYFDNGGPKPQRKVFPVDS